MRRSSRGSLGVQAGNFSRFAHASSNFLSAFSLPNCEFLDSYSTDKAFSVSGVFYLQRAGVGLNRSRRSDTEGRGGYAARSCAGTTEFLRALLPKVQSSSLLQEGSELGERRYNSGYLNYKGGHLRYNSAPESYKRGHSFYKTAVQSTETPEICPVFNAKGSQGKLPSERQTLSKRYTVALRWHRNALYGVLT